MMLSPERNLEKLTNSSPGVIIMLYSARHIFTRRIRINHIKRFIALKKFSSGVLLLLTSLLLFAAIVGAAAPDPLSGLEPAVIESGVYTIQNFSDSLYLNALDISYASAGYAYVDKYSGEGGGKYSSAPSGRRQLSALSAERNRKICAVRRRNGTWRADRKAGRYCLRRLFQYLQRQRRLCTVSKRQPSCSLRIRQKYPLPKTTRHIGKIHGRRRTEMDDQSGSYFRVRDQNRCGKNPRQQRERGVRGRNAGLYEKFCQVALQR